MVDALAMVPGCRVVGLMHLDRVRVMIDRDVRRAAERSFDAVARAAAAGEQVDDQLAWEDAGDAGDAELADHAAI